MKKLVASCLLASVVGMGSTSFAAFSISGDMTFASEYIFRGIKLAENTFQPSVEVAVDDFYVGVWGSLPTEKRNSMGYTDEWDAYAGYGLCAQRQPGSRRGCDLLLLPGYGPR